MANELERKLQDFANILRAGAVDPADYKGYVFPLLFLKRICDTFEAELAANVDMTDLSFQVPEGCRWPELRAVAADPTRADLGAEIATAFEAIELSNGDLLKDVFGDMDWGNTRKVPTNVLRSMIATLSTIDLDPEHASADVLGDAYESLLKDFAENSGKRAGEFYTPRGPVKLCMHLIAPQQGESVYDPTCGSGGMLIGAIAAAREIGVDPRTLRLYGQELNPSTAGIARMNLYIHGLLDGKIAQGDTLGDPQWLDDGTGGIPDAPVDPDRAGQLMQFDCCIANPPFSIGKGMADGWAGYTTWANDRFGRGEHGVPPKSTADWAFVEHMVASLKPDTGRMAVILPLGALEREVEAGIRKSLVDKGLVMAVIGLAPNLFYNTSIPVAVLIVSRAKRPELGGRVLFIDASARFVKGKKQNTMSDEDIAAIVAAYRTATDPDGDGGVRVALVSTSDIAGAGYTLSLKRFFAVEEVAAADPRLAFTAWSISGEDLARAEDELRAALKEAGLVA